MCRVSGVTRELVGSAAAAGEGLHEAVLAGFPFSGGGSSFGWGRKRVDTGCGGTSSVFDCHCAAAKATRPGTSPIGLFDRAVLVGAWMLSLTSAVASPVAEVEEDDGAVRDNTVAATGLSWLTPALRFMDARMAAIVALFLASTAALRLDSCASSRTARQSSGNFPTRAARACAGSVIADAAFAPKSWELAAADVEIASSCCRHCCCCCCCGSNFCCCCW